MVIDECLRFHSLFFTVDWFLMFAANLVDLIQGFDKTKLMNFCKILAVTVSDLDVFDNRSSREWLYGWPHTAIIEIVLSVRWLSALVSLKYLFPYFGTMSEQLSAIYQGVCYPLVYNYIKKKPVYLHLDFWNCVLYLRNSVESWWLGR